MSTLGLDVGGTYVKWVHLGADGITARGTIATSTGGPAATAAALAAIVGDRAPSRVGVAIPGHLTPDMESTTVIPNLAGHWDRYPLAPTLRTLTSRPATLVNDARAFALAEMTLGAAQDRPDAVFLAMGTGIGGAIALGGTILRSPGDRSGEVGHVTVDPEGLHCGCGSRGCLETIAGGRALTSAWSARRRIDAGSVTPQDVVTAARSGDRDAQNVLDAAGAALGLALGSTLALLGLNTVVIGGGVAPAFDLMRPAVRRVLEARSGLLGPIEFLPALLGAEAGAIGAALHAIAPDEQKPVSGLKTNEWIGKEQA